MDQEVRSSDIFTVLANLMDSQSHGMQSSQNNNNNSNPNNLSLRQNTIGTDSSLPSTQAEVSAAQVMNAHILNMTGQAAAGIPVSNGSASDAEIAEIERLSAFMNPNFTNAGGNITSQNAQDPLYEAASQIGMQTEVGNVLDSRLPAYSSTGIDFTSSQNQALLEAAFNTIDTSTVASLSSAPSYVSLLQQQPGDLWMGQSGGVSATGNYAVNTGNKQQSGNTRTPSSYTHGHNVQSSSPMDKTSSPHHIHSSSSKSTMLMQHTSGMQTSNKGNRTSQQYNHNAVQYRQNSKSRNDLVLPVNNDGLPLGNGKEKKLTTTPIPSDADKSSCSSTSSGSISGPEHSPDHISDHPSSSSADLNRHNMDDSVLMGLSQKGGRTIRNIEGSKNYPCYGNMNLVNFGTINFTPVMDNSHNTMSSGDAARNQQEGNIPAPTSDSVIEIDESVTSPLENIPMSPTTPMAMDQSAVLSQAFPDMHKISMGGRGSFTQMQTVTTVRQVRNADPNTHAAARKLKSASVDPLRRPVNVHKTTDPNGNSGKITQDYGKNFASLSTVTQDKLQEKLKKPRSSKHKQGQQQRQDNFQPNLHGGGEVARFDFATINNNTHQAQPSHLKPKVNADPTIRFKQNTDTTIHPSLNQFTRQPIPQGTGAFTPGLNTKQLGSPPVNQYPNPVAHNINSTNNSGFVTGGSDTPSSSRGRSRQWQTVTAVQGPKLPPMLSEQDRIPKRGRPSKKMMQQNLKVKKDNAAAKTQSVLPTQGVLPVVPLVVSQPEVVQPRLPSSNLVSTYTINDKGLMEEIAPKPKENRRSKERTQAFMKYLNEIKTSSKQQQLSSNLKPGEKEKTEGEKQKKRSRPRTKVFGRQVPQPLTESGITETMYTFSALAHQFKISSSIVERATENLLKSAAMKRNKEQQSNALVGPHPQRPMPDKNNNHKNLQPVTQSVTNKGVPLASSHCEPKTTTSSKVPNVPTIKLPGSTSFKQVDNRVADPSSAESGITADKVVHIRQETVQTDTRVPSTIGPKISAVSAPVPAHTVQKQIPATETLPMPDLNRNDTVEVTDDVLPDSISVSDSDHVSSKGKHKKKKHKKHKKHKYADSNSAKKKKKDKERKKKSKKKLKTKLTPSIIPSTSVSLVKPAMKATLTPESDAPSTLKKSTPRTSAFTSRNKTNNFTSGFRQTSNTDLDIPWSQDDNTYDAEDSSSDEASASPKSNADTTPESSFSKSVSSSKLFAQYSNSRIGFGTFSIPAPKSSSPDTQTQKAPVTSVSAAMLSSTESTDASFSSQGLARSGKKHSKHKKKKFFRKSKTCDPAFAAILDELLNGVRDLKLDASSKSNQGTFARSSSNIFAATSVVDSSQSLLWRSPTTTTSSASRKNSSSNATAKKTAFPRSNRVSMLGRVGKPDSNKKGQLGLGKAVSLPQPDETKEAVESLSVFCRSPFFQKYGYISKSHPKPTSINPPTVDSKKVPKSSKTTDKTTPAHTPSISKTTTATRKEKRADKVDVDVGLKQLEEHTPTQAKRKRGWPRGKPRGPRAKRANTDLSPIASVTDKTLLSPATREKDEKPLFAVDKTEPKSERPKESPKKAAPAYASTSTDNQEPKPGSSSASTGPTDDLSKLVSESLLQQIKQAIEANLPKNFNKDAINKSVDAAVQSCLQNMANTSPETPTVPESEPTKKKTGRRQIRNSSVEACDKVAEEMSPKANTDIHPKKLWACKHQDTESSTTSKTTESPLPTLAVPKKRGPGRPRKNFLSKGRMSKQSTARQSATTTKQGKVPTASATVVPSKRKLLTVRLGGKPATKQPAVKRLIARAKNDIVSRPAPKTPRQASRVISKEAALSCLSALCSIKAVKVLAKSGDKDSHTVVGFYGGTELETHIVDAINTTVEIYQWDNYRHFNEACSQVEKQMGFADDMDSFFGDNRPKNLSIKKSIESVVEKLKNKQAQQSVHSAATALLELHNTASSPNQDDNVIIIDHRNPDNEKYRTPGRKQDIYEKVSPYKKDSTQSSKQHKVKVTQSLNTSVSGGPVKRRRGRPRKNQVHEDTEPPVKKQKTNTDSDHKTSRNGTLSSKDSETTSGKGKQRKGAKGRPSAGQNMDPTHSSKKPYIAAGLYSSTFKKDSKSSHRHFADILTSKAKLPAPLDAGLYLRSTLKDFQLPYNVWWMYKHKKISPTQDPSTNYVEVTQNVYTNPRPALNLSDHICTCNPQEGENCSSKDCLNRLMYIECQSSSCPCGQSCTNQAIQNRSWCDSLERFKTKDRGWGVRTTKVVSEGAFILEYVGEVVSEAEFRTRMIELYHAYSNHYCVQLDASTVIDGYRMSNEGRFVNHSCEPNCEMQKWCVNGEHRIGLFALKQIQPSEELTYDYNFHAYDINMQQECRCGSKNCRGFIGGRVQRVLSSDSDSVSNVLSTSTKQSKPSARETKLKSFKSKGDEATVKEFSILQMQPISKEDKEMIRSQQLFLLRNLVQVRRKEEEQGKQTVKKSGDSATSSKSGHKSKPKKSHQSEEESAKVEAALTEMYTAIATCKDQNGVSVAIPFMNLPSKKKNPEYYERISDPIDLSIIERNIVSNHYKDIETFNNDVQRVFKNAEKYHGRKSTLGKDVFRLRKAYANARGAAMLLLNGHKKPSKSSEFSEEDMDEADENIHRKNEDHIRCICCIYKDEGLMVQCEKCYVWQHCDCMGVKPGNTDRYLCEECDPRAFSREVKVIPPPPNTPPGHTYFLTLLRDDLLVKQGDCAYLMRDHRLRHNSNSPSVRASHRNLATLPTDKLDIFRIEQLWTDERGDKYAYGYHFLRPNETHHAPSRTFYHNELFASPFYEIIPLEAVVGSCCVMDLYTYCKGKPKDFKMCDIYICDFRTDKAAGCFTRITKKRYPICTKPHVFDTYKHKICPKKDFQPHHIPEQYRKSSGRPPTNNGTDQDVPDFSSQDDETKKRRLSEDSEDGESSLGFSFFDKSEVGSSAWKKRQRLDGIASKLLSKLPKQAVDVSYLLEPGTGKRQRKKTQVSLESLSQQK